MTRIVLVGAGSVEFTRNLLGDFLSYPELRDAEIVLHDIDADRLATAERMATWTAAALGAPAADRRPRSIAAGRSAMPTSSSTRSRSAARGRPGSTSTSRRATGSSTRSTTPSTWAVSCAVCAPSRWCWTSSATWRTSARAPRSSTTPTRCRCSCGPIAEWSELPTVGLCHSVYWTVRALADYVGLAVAGGRGRVRRV